MSSDNKSNSLCDKLRDPLALSAIFFLLNTYQFEKILLDNFESFRGPSGKMLMTITKTGIFAAFFFFYRWFMSEPVETKSIPAKTT